MKIELKAMYSFLISHTFPGLLVLIEILLFYQWYVDPHFWEFLKYNWPSGTGAILVVIILAYAISTLLGIVLDGIHHFVLEDFLRKQAADNKFCAIKDDLSLEVYKHFLEDDLWYPYEAYANVSLAMVPGVILVYHWSTSILHLEVWQFSLLLLLYIIILGVIFSEAVYTYRRFVLDEEEFIQVFSARQGSDPSQVLEPSKDD